MIAVSAAFVLSDAAGSTPARRTSRPSSSRKVRASITAATRPSPCGSKAHPADRAGATEHNSRRQAVTYAAQRNAVLVITLLFVRPVAVCCATIVLLSEKTAQVDIMEINGVAHIFLTSSNYQCSREFYRKLLPFFFFNDTATTE